MKRNLEKDFPIYTQVSYFQSLLLSSQVTYLIMLILHYIYIPYILFGSHFFF